MKKPVWRLELQKAFPRQRGIMVGVHDRQPMSSLIKVLELTGRRRFALRAVASCLWTVQEPRKASNANACSMTHHRFPPPWSAEELDACYVVHDHSGQPLAQLTNHRCFMTG